MRSSGIVILNAVLIATFLSSVALLGYAAIRKGPSWLALLAVISIVGHMYGRLFLNLPTEYGLALITDYGPPVGFLITEKNLTLPFIVLVPLLILIYLRRTE